MHLHAGPSVAAELPASSHEQLGRLARSVELRRQQLEEDINAYIARKQDELRQYEQELVEQHRSMERGDGPGAAPRRSSADLAGSSEEVEQSPLSSPSPLSSLPEQQQQQQQQQQQKKQKKHGRVHKREKELYGLVTPVFLPLLDAREPTSPTEREKKAAKQAKRDADAGTTSAPTPGAEQSAAAARDAEHSRAERKPQKETKDAGSDMAGETPPAKERSASDPVVKKSRRSSIKKKSALRHSSTPRSRKRVSLVIDDQVVLPSDMIQEPALTSPSSETTSATNSTASLDDVIDPRLTSPDAPVYIEHHDAVHHSLPMTMTQPKTSPIKTSPIKTSAPPLSQPAPVVAEAARSPPTSPAVRSPTTPFAPPSYATRSFLDPAPEHMHMDDLSMPATAGPGPIFPSDPSDPRLTDREHVGSAGGDFSTYVGGLSGSGVDDVNQVGSVGYPSSLGASYLESYMQTRPLSVRMLAAEREGDADEVKRLRAREAEERAAKEKERDAREKEEEREDGGRRGVVVDEDWDIELGGGEGRGTRDGDEDDFMGSMEDF